MVLRYAKLQTSLVMSHVQEQQKRLMSERLQSHKELSQQEVQDIVYALQVASGSATGVGKIKGILQYLKQDPVYITSEDGTQIINDKFELANLIRSIDEYIDIASDRDFKGYF